MATSMTNPIDFSNEEIPSTQISDLCNLEEVTLSKISEVLYERYQSELYTTKLGSKILLIYNPDQKKNELKLQEEEKQALELIQQWKLPNGYFDTMDKLQPSIYDLAYRVYFHLRRTSLDQSVLFCGFKGSGKTYNQQRFLKGLSMIRNHVKKERNLYQKIENSEKILNIFGSTLNEELNNNSRFAKYSELQFDSKGRTIGIKYLIYLLEKERLILNDINNTQFLIFYHFILGTNLEEKKQFHLLNYNNFHYLPNLNWFLNKDEIQQDFLNLKLAMKSLGFTKKSQSQIFQLLAGILHLGNIRFINRKNLDNEEGAMVNDYDQLCRASELLGLQSENLEQLLTYKTHLIKKETCTLFLDAQQALKQRDELAKTLYSLLFEWITEYINAKLCKEEPMNFIGLLNVPGFNQTNNFNDNNLLFGFETFSLNFINERIYNYIWYQLFESGNQTYLEDNIILDNFNYQSNDSLIELFIKPNNGLISIITKQLNRIKGNGNDLSLLQNMQKQIENNSSLQNNLIEINLNSNQFTIKHFHEQVNYSIEGFIEQNKVGINKDFIFGFKGLDGECLCNNSFIEALFNQTNLNDDELFNQKDENLLVSNLPKRKPSMKRERINLNNSNNEDNNNNNNNNNKSNNNKDDKMKSKIYHLKLGFDELFDTFDNTEMWFIFCMNSIQTQSNIQQSIELLNIKNLILRKKKEYSVCYLYDEFLERYQSLLLSYNINKYQSNKEQIEQFQSLLNWNSNSLLFGNQFIYIKEFNWIELELHLQSIEKGIHFNLDENKSNYSDDELGSELDSNLGEASTFDLELEKQINELDNENDENYKPPKTKIRKAWICLTWSLTWWIPSYFLTCCGRMKRKDIRMAWREKFTLCLIILFLSAIVVLFIVGVNPLLCPERNLYTVEELRGTKDSNYLKTFSLYGRVYDFDKISNIKNGHYGVNYNKMVELYAGTNLDDAFPIQINPQLCVDYQGNEIPPYISLTNRTNNPLFINHDHRYYRGEFNYNEQWFENVITNRMKKVGDMAYTFDDIQKRIGQDELILIYKDQTEKKPVLRVYNFDRYSKLFNLFRENDEQTSINSSTMKFLGPIMEDLIYSKKGHDVTKEFDKLFNDDQLMKERILSCMNNLFYYGLVDDRNSPQCVFAQYLLLALSIFLFLILFVKFLASLQLGTRPEPENHDQFVICNVPCYTEDLESLKRTIDSLAVLKYDDKRKLLFIIADGMVIGGGNELPTPRILLNLLGSDPNLNPEPLSFVSLGEGLKQHNMGKVYTGLYEIRGHAVPYIVVVKVGKPSERIKPGNRGKRDSQLIMMKFFNKVHYDHPMVPLELEIYHQMKNIIGVDPKLYEFILMVDADTIVMNDSLNRLVSAMLHDIKIMGICGETSIMNERDSWATMIQVYEYFMSHHLAKSFESLFGSVTCLPGCFSMYRIRSSDNETPLLIHDIIIKEYSENKVDTLHKKNLFHLGEDRYLTTLMLKHFPFYKMTFTPDAKCLTNAPDTWNVLLSQRRRWINSTVHNLLELVFLPKLCGFCCFSMRFIVFMDLLSTVIMPATLGYLGYLIYRLATDRNSTIPIASLVFIGAPYVLQMIVFLIRRQWQQIGWMFIYLLALPIFAFFIPIYSFWHFDDFSWGNTRIVVGEGGKKKKVNADEGKFDASTIPLLRWQDYEDQKWELATEKTSYSHHSSPSSNSLNKPPLTNANSMPFAVPNIQNMETSVYNPTYPSQSTTNSHLSQQQFNLISNFRPISTFSTIPMANLPNTKQSTNTPPQQPLHPIYYNNYSNSQPPSPPHNQLAYPSMTTIPTLPNFIPPADFPSNIDIIQQIRYIISISDLNTVTKKQVRNQLAQYFNLDLEGGAKEQVNTWIQMVFQGEL